MTDRERFEEWVLTQYDEDDHRAFAEADVDILTRAGDGYYHMDTQIRREAWQAAVAAERARLVAILTEERVSSNHWRYLAALDWAIQQINR